MSKLLLYLFFSLFITETNSDSTTTLYHEFEETTSGYRIVEWNTDRNFLPDHFIKETIDKNGRVIQLEMLNNGELYYPNLCQFDPLITFDYPSDSTIVVTQFQRPGIYGGNLECDSPTRTTYYYSSSSFKLLKSKSEIILSERVKELWLKEMSEEELNNLLDTSRSINESPFFVFWYLYSYTKLNGMFPIGQNFDINGVFLSQKIKEEILRTLPKQNAH